MKPKRKKKLKTEFPIDSDSYTYSVFDDPNYDFDGEDVEELKFSHAQRRIDALVANF